VDVITATATYRGRKLIISAGHGFKFSILIGRILADLVERGETDYPIGMFNLDRFGP
jgi:glycine/D-amino acid oxidase-like deaminating enzyme